MLIQVGIIQTIILGVAAYRCKCVNCKWESKPFAKEQAAIKTGKKHICEGYLK